MVRLQYGGKFKPSGILKHHTPWSFFDIAFQYEFIKYSALVTQRILFYPAGEKPPGTVTRAIHHPRQAIFIIFPAIFHHETNDTYADSHAPIADHVYSVSEPA